MALFTGKGDNGTTKAFDTPSGVRFSKSSALTEALGTLDELNSYIGLAKAVARTVGYKVPTGKKDDEVILDSVLHEIQQNLFIIQAEVAGADKKIAKAKVTAMEKMIEKIEKMMPPITTFLIPGGTILSAHLDVARTIARRVERRVIAVVEDKERKLSKYSLAYLNRLSSLLYALVRYVNYLSGADERSPSYE